MLKMRKNTKGFTLIELIVVLCILVILALLVVPRVVGFQDQAKIAADREAIETMNHGIALFCASNNVANIVGQTSINVPVPIANGASITVIMQWLKDKGLLEQSASIYFPVGHAYIAAENRVS